LIADFIRYQLVYQGIDFSFETVMSHAAKVHFLRFAREHGFLTYVYFIATSESLINVERVKNRVLLGGHDVPQHLIEKRYLKSLENLKLAIEIADRAFVIDNSFEFPELLLEKKGIEKVETLADSVPIWFSKYYLEKS
jgi:predicted ABC-type ATPase